MRQVIVELDDKEMAKLEAIARERRVEPAEVLKAAVIKGLMTNGRPVLVKGRYVNWRDLRAALRGQVTATATSGNRVAGTRAGYQADFLITDAQLRQFAVFSKMGERIRRSKITRLPVSGTVEIGILSLIHI